MLRLEFEEPDRFKCECCGGTTVTLTGLVRDDDEPRAVYHARFGAHHATRSVQAIISIGAWEEGSGPWDRLAFPFEIRVGETDYQIGLIDAKASPWQDTQPLGRVLDRAEALQHERLPEVFHIADHMVADDPELRAFLEGAA